ncbi:hypothetical protein HXA34_01765 [Salipaludibacillus agaradhaerens]|jgi:hypothetical protein|uniref:hypothetical protein n=1 Tax=Salipaludibacillus agaradhaerens TaxID=76935 RepID=UPI002151BDE6|nr:hypothetical protein [Salipaludibacillus agaradhaerens]MCR6105011.1 hypothetical protein [Salipaludibacillus agaradhaerens]MCR6117056.1 hypothetical protein [Salipaludibacillus agaradhaerens]
MGNYIAEKELLNDMITEYTQVMMEYNKHRQNFAEVGGIRERIEYNVARNNSNALVEFWENMVSADSEAAANFEEVTKGFVTLSTTIDSFKGDLGKGGANLESLDIEKLNSLMFKDDALYTRLMAKMSSEEGLTRAEKVLLAEYIRKEILTDEKIEEFEEFAELIKNDSLEEVEERVNQLLKSEEDLDQYITDLEAFLFTEDIQHVEEAHRLLYGYLAILKNSREYVTRSKGATRVYDLEKLDVTIKLESDKPEGINKYVLTARLRVGEEYINYGGLNHYSALSKMRPNTLSIDIYNGPNANSEITKEENKILKKEYEAYAQHYWFNELSSVVLGIVASRLGGEAAALGVDAIVATGEFQEGKNDLATRITRNDLLVTAGYLEMAVSMADGALGGANQYQLFTTHGTELRLERWERMHQLNPDIPYPAKAIENEEWLKVGEVYSEFSDDFSSRAGYNEKLLYYVAEGEEVLDGETLEEIAIKPDEEKVKE